MALSSLTRLSKPGEADRANQSYRLLNSSRGGDAGDCGDGGVVQAEVAAEGRQGQPQGQEVADPDAHTQKN